MAYVTVKQAAASIGTDPKTLRRFMRAYVTRKGGVVGVDTPGRGGRYAIDEDSMLAMHQAFDAWRARSAGAIVFTLDVEDDAEDVEDDA
jgi:hypothetical protein